MRIARVFPRRTKASPDDALAFFEAPGLFPPKVDAVHVSCAFTYDIPEAERLAREWERIAPVTIGGPAFGKPAGEFVPGRYLKPGYVITSRGCPNRCWFCSVWKREGGGPPRELPITDGWNVLDDNLIACSDAHVRAVFAMLKRQPHPAEFTGGLEAARLREWHVEELARMRVGQMFFAYDTPDDYEPLVNASRLLSRHRWGSHDVRCYIFIGYPARGRRSADSFTAAEVRIIQAMKLGFFPMAMLWKNRAGKTTRDWRRFQRLWARPGFIAAQAKAMGIGTHAAPHI